MFTANKTVDQVLSVFRKTIDELTKVEDNHTIAAVEQEEQIKKLRVSVHSHKMEAKYASDVRAKLSAIFN